MFQGGVSPDGSRTIFGYKTAALRDERVRQALSMSWDRDLWIDVFYNTDNFSKEGLPIERRWNTAFTATDSDVASGLLLDPKDSKFGPNAKFFRHDVAEAKKLLAAAGYPNGLDLTSNYAVGSIYTANHKKMEVLNEFEREVGLRFTPKQVDYNTEFIPQMRDSKGQFEGTSWKTGPSALSTNSVGRLAFDYAAASGASFYGFDAGGKGDASGDPHVESSIRKAQSELDTEKRKSIVHDLQRYLGQKQYAVRWPGGATSFVMAWPALQNFRVWTGSRDSHITLLHWWLDETKAPNKKA
jgi:peptide/nickel transport system substrate-binding protein